MSSETTAIILPSDDNVPPKPALPNKNGLVGSRLQSLLKNNYFA
jgi:hypothetical protein